MAMNYEGVKKELEKIFTSSFGERKIVFWYDEPRNFEDNIKDDNFSFTKLIVYNNNSFEIKHILEAEDKTSNYLLYFPMKKPRNEENWLLDILLYSDEYYADTVALTMRKYNLTTDGLRDVIKKHITFFNNKQRVERLKQFVILDDNLSATELMNGMTAVLCKLRLSKLEQSTFKTNSIQLILRELVFEYNESEKYDELVKFGFDDYLWSKIVEYTNFSGQNIKDLIKTFMMTSVVKTSDLEGLSGFYKHYIIEEYHYDTGIEDALIFIHYLKNDERYDFLQERLSSELRIEELISHRGIKDIANCDVFKVFDDFIVKSIINSLNQGSLDFGYFESVIKDHRANSMWYKDYACYYDFILNAIRFLRKMETYIPEGLSSNEYIKEYTENLSDIDLYYRKAITCYKLIEERSEELEDFVTRLDLMYENKYLSRLGDCFSESLEDKQEWNFPGLLMSTSFYREIQRTPYKKMFVIISDALRFEVGKDLVNTLSSDEKLKGTVEIKPMISTLPSVTKFGMAALLPHKEISYEKKSVYVDGVNSNSTDNRRKIMKNKNASYDVLRYNDVENMTGKDLRTFMSDKSLVYIYHDRIDNAGEHDEDRVFEASKDAIEELSKLVKKLYNALQYSNFFITSDHGFLYKRSKLENHHKYDDIVSLGLDDKSRRFLISESSVNIPYTHEFVTKYLNDNKVVLPYSSDVFKTQGGGMQYVHGGASLQEVVIPLIKISELRADRYKDVGGPVGVRIKSVQRKITNRSFALEFEQYEKIEDKKKERAVLVRLVDESNEVVSGEYVFIANSTSDNPDSRVTKLRMALNNIEFDRNKRYFLEMRDKETNEIIEKEQFVIDILAFKTIF